MPSCAACQTPFTKERRGLKCTLCDERRVAEPAYYCDKSCQKNHWREHKAFHAQLKTLDLPNLKSVNGLRVRAPSPALG